MARMSRRAFLSRSAATALAVSGGVLLSACGKRDATGAAPAPAAPSWPARSTRSPGRSRPTRAGSPTA
jgi:anaerobic selenocysteine-containing dehydrogenase